MFLKNIYKFLLVGYLMSGLSGCFLEDLLETPITPYTGPGDILLKYENDSTYAYQSQVDTVQGIDTCFKCFPPGTTWLYYSYLGAEIGRESARVYMDTITIKLDSLIGIRYYFTKIENNNNTQFVSTFAADILADSVSWIDPLNYNANFDLYQPFHMLNHFTSKPFRLDNGAGCYYDYNGGMYSIYSYNTSDLGTILRGRNGGMNSKTYILLLEFNGQPINAGYLLREMQYKHGKPVR